VGSADESFENFYRATSRKIALNARLSYDNPDDIDDAVQDAFTATYRDWRRVSRFDDDGRQWYVMRAVMNKLHSQARRWKIHRRALDHLGHRDVETLLHVEEAALASEAIRAIRNLPQRQRVIAVMHWVNGVPLVDIASALGISASAARTHLARARTTLVKELGEQAPGLGLRAGQP
jgi:RNA polymerase sigma-70 factor, ECF subfamily